MESWTEEKMGQLAQLYKEHPLLWNTRHKDYKNRNRKYDALKKIGDVMNISVIELERKLNVMITQFRRTRKKLMAMKKSGAGADEIERKMWFGYKMLLFLEDRFTTTESKTAGVQEEHQLERPISDVELSIIDDNEEAQEITNDDFNSEENLNISSQPVIKRPRNKISTSTQASTNKRNTVVDSQINDAYLVMKDLVASTMQPAPKDEYDLYGKQIALKLKKMDPITRTQTQHRINCVLHDSEMQILGRNLEFHSRTDSSCSPTPYSVPSPSSTVLHDDQPGPS